MKKVIFKINEHEVLIVKPTDEKFFILAYFLGTDSYPDSIQETIDMLEKVQSGANTWEELVEPYGGYNALSFGEGAGYLECDRGNALLVSYDGDYENVEMPLQELIDLMKEWLAFMS